MVCGIFLYLSSILHISPKRSLASSISTVDKSSYSSSTLPFANTTFKYDVSDLNISTMALVACKTSDGNISLPNKAFIKVDLPAFTSPATDNKNLPVPFKVITGTDVDSSPFDSDSYCGGYSNQLALEFTQNWLDSCSDGFLECSSQEAAGSVWFRDTQVMDGGEPLSHQQSRRPCFGLDEVLRDDI